MDHQVFEELLFAFEKLSPEQAQALNEHLQGCDACRHLSTAQQVVETRLRSAAMAGAEPGFAARWQMRLRESELRLQRRQSLAVLAFVIGIIALLAGSLAVLAVPLIQSPAILLLTLTYRVMELVSFANSAGDTVVTLFQTAAGVVPVWAWVILIGLLTQLAVLWVVSYRLLTRPRSVTK